MMNRWQRLFEGIRTEIKVFIFFSVLLTAFRIVFLAVFFIVMFIPVLIGIFIGIIAEYNYSTVLIVVAISIPVVTWIAVVVIAWIKLLYFRETFYIRDMKIIETYKYSLAISKETS